MPCATSSCMLGKVSVQLRAEQRKSLPGRAGMKDRGVERGGQSALPASRPNLPPHHLPWPYLPGTVWVGSGYTQMLCQVSNAGETEAAARAGAGYLLPCRTHRSEGRGVSPSLLHPRCPGPYPREACMGLQLPYDLLLGPSPSASPNRGLGLSWPGSQPGIHLGLSKW